MRQANYHESRLSRRAFVKASGKTGAAFIAAASVVIMPSRTVGAATDISAELHYASTTILARLIREKRVSSVEVVKAYLDRISRINPELNAVVQIAAESALQRARAADQARARGEDWGPLHGVPITIKDNINTAEIVTAVGTMGRKEYVPAEDAVVVRRLKGAGAILLGKTNVPEMGMAYETDNLVYGRTQNPHDLALTPGGSSGGEAAAIAAGLSPFGVGNDGGGSIRVPAHFCGIAGLKPSQGRIPLTGCEGGSAFQFIWMVSHGPMARYVEDLGLGLPILVGPDGRDPQCRSVPLLDYRQVKIAGLEVAFFTDNGIVTPTAETVDTVVKAVKSLADAGARVVERKPPNVDRSYEISMSLVAPAFRVGFEQVQAYYRTKPEDTSQTVREHLIPFDKFLAQSKLSDVAEREKANWEWYDFRCTMNVFMRDYDVMVLPVAAHPAVKHGATNRNLADFSYAQMVNLTGHPAAVVRCGTSAEGLPIGVQIVAGTDQDHMAIAVAAFLEQELGGWKRSELVDGLLAP